MFRNLSFFLRIKVMADSEQKGLELIAEAEKKLKSAQGFSGALFGGPSRIEDACDLYHRAANAFKMAQNWTAAASAYCEAADLQLKLERPHEAATLYCDAGNCYKKIDPEEAVTCLRKAVELYTDMGKFTTAAKHLVSIAEIYEVDDIEKAISCYEQAADYYIGEESNVSGTRCSLKVAKFCGELEQYEKAIDIYETVAASSLKNPLLKYNAREYFFQAALCHLCVDLLTAQVLFEKLEEQDVDGFTDAVNEYDAIAFLQLDQWYKSILLRIKKTIEGTIDLR